jgi:hypothetical protein
MVNASLNWASIVGIVLAVGGALLYFMRSFKPALARDYDVFFAAVGLLCGGILFFQGWRLDPILQFGQFLLAGTTVFFAYESVRLRGVTTEQARDRFDEPQPIRRRIRSRPEDEEAEDFYRPRRAASRAAIPERAASRSRAPESWESPSAAERPSEQPPRRFESGSARGSEQEFGARRRERETGGQPRRGSRPGPGTEMIPRSSRRPPATPAPAGVPQGSPIRSGRSNPSPQISDADFTPLESASSGPSSEPAPPAASRPRDNSSRFDD